MIPESAQVAACYRKITKTIFIMKVFSRYWY